MIAKLDSLNAKTRQALLLATQKLREKGVQYAITSTYRTVIEQSALYAQGRDDLPSVNEKRKAAGMGPIAESENKYTITNCDGLVKKSRHQSGDAVDIVPLDGRGRPYWPDASSSEWTRIADIMKQFGFDWGGDWKEFKDCPHYEYRRMS